MSVDDHQLHGLLILDLSQVAPALQMHSERAIILCSHAAQDAAVLLGFSAFFSTVLGFQVIVVLTRETGREAAADALVFLHLTLSVQPVVQIAWHSRQGQ